MKNMEINKLFIATKLNRLMSAREYKLSARFGTSMSA